jgi:hypothetical protein
MFTKNSVSQSMIDAVQSVLAEDKKLLLEPGKKKEDVPFDGPYKKPDTKPGHGDASRVKHLAKMAIPKGEVKEELKGNQGVLDKNHNGKIDKQDFKLLRMKKEGVLDAIKSGAKKIMDKVAPDDDKLLSNLEKETGGKRPNMYNKPKNEEVELDEAINDNMHPIGVALLKHIKPEHHNLYKPHLTTDVFNGSFKDRHDVLSAAKQAGHLKEDIGAMQSVVGENKGKKAIRVDTLKGVTTSTDPEVKIANAHFSGKSATLKAEGKGTDTAIPFVTDSATHKEINRAVKPTFKKIKEMLGKTGTSE